MKIQAVNQIVKNALYSNIEESLNRIISDADDF